MPKFRYLGELLSSLTQSAANRFAGHLKREEHGNPAEIETPFWDNATAQVVRERWWRRIKYHPAFKVAPVLQTEEEEQGAKTAGFASIALPWSEVEHDFLEPFFGEKEIQPKIDAVVLARAINVVRTMLSGRRTPLPLEVAQQRAPRRTSSGLPEWSTDPEVLPEYLARSKDIAVRQDPSLFYPFAAGRRTTNSTFGEVSKQRLLWIVDKAEVPLGKSVGDVVLEELRLKDHFSAWLGPEYVDRAVTKMLHRQLPIHSVDFSKYDASVENPFIQAAFELLMDWVKADYLEVVGEHFMNGQLAHPGGIRSGKQRGVPSGSSLTNMIDTLVQAILWHYIAIEADTTLVDFMVLGDDGLVQFAPERTPDQIEPLAASVGFKFNADKTMYAIGAAHFLQNLHTLSLTSGGIAVGMRSSLRMLNRIKRPERLSASLSPALLSVGAALKIDKCYGLPYFKELVQFYWEGDKLVRAKPLIDLMREAGGSTVVKSALKIDSFSVTERDPQVIQALPVSKELELIRRR